MNRTLKRPMFRIGGSAGTGITSGLDQPQKMANGGRIEYNQGTMPNFQMSGLPGFLTGFGLNLLATPPRGNIFQTAGMAAREPFNQLQISQARSRELEGERDFLRSETDRKIDASAAETDKLIASREKIAGMKDGDANVMAFAEVYKDASGAPNMIKGANAAKFPEKYQELITEYGEESVSVSPIDASTIQTKKQINLFIKQNPGYIGKVYYDVASGKGVKFVKDVETGDLALVPADGVMDTEGDNMPPPNTSTPGLFGQKTKPDVITPAVKEFLEDKDRPDFGIGFYDQ